jgi:hypothetical protein
VLKNKLALEKKITTELKAHFKAVAMAVANDGELPSVKSIIEKHNKRVTAAIVRPGKDNFLRSNLINNAVKDNSKIVTSHYKSIDRETKDLIGRSREAARDILTDKKTDEKGNVTAMEYKASSGVLNKTTAKVLDNYNQSRIPTIAITETNTLYEASNYSVFNQLQDTVDDDIESGDIDELDEIDGMYDSLTFDEVTEMVRSGEDKEKIRGVVIAANQTWVTMGDDKVRDAHAEVDGQQVPIGEPFSVSGYDMLYPGDDSDGAPMELIINCRCNSVY